MGKRAFGNRKIIAVCLLVLYVLFILTVTLLSRKPTDGEHLRLELFWSYKVIDEQFWQMFLNVLLFIPFGFLLQIWDKRILPTLLTGCLFSCVIESLQFLLRLGLCEFDDVFHNTLGTLIGAAIVLLARRLVPGRTNGSADRDERGAGGPN